MPMCTLYYMLLPVSPSSPTKVDTRNSTYVQRLTCKIPYSVREPDNPNLYSPCSSIK